MRSSTTRLPPRAARGFSAAADRALGRGRLDPAPAGLARLFAQIQRILEINQLTTVTREVVETARESLVIGAT